MQYFLMISGAAVLILACLAVIKPRGKKSTLNKLSPADLISLGACAAVATIILIWKLV